MYVTREHLFNCQVLNERQSAQWHYSFYCRRGLRTKSSRSALKFGLPSQVENSRQTIFCSLSNSRERGETGSPPSLFRRPPVESEYAPPSGLVIWCCVNWFNCCSRKPVQKRALTALVKDENCPVKRSRLRPLRGGGCLSQFAFFGDVMRIRLVYPANKEHFHRSERVAACSSLTLLRPSHADGPNLSFIERYLSAA